VSKAGDWSEAPPAIFPTATPISKLAQSASTTMATVIRRIPRRLLVFSIRVRDSNSFREYISLVKQ
jgi:hypothetical protein